MICNKCDKDMAECTCADAPERIRSVLACEYVYIGSEYRQRLEKHAKEVEQTQVVKE